MKNLRQPIYLVKFADECRYTCAPTIINKIPKKTTLNETTENHKIDNQSRECLS